MTTGSAFYDKLQKSASRSGGLLCVGLDPEPAQVPERYRGAADPLLAWNRDVIASTQEFACAYKPNIAFYEALGRQGYDLLEATLAAVPPGIPVILDAKRGDIGSTAEAYAKAVFDVWGADAVTLSPYLGGDSLEPFLRRADKGAFVLCHTSNPGAGQLQTLPVAGRPLYQAVAEQVVRWSKNGNAGLVVGATYPERLQHVRAIAPDLWILVPGVGAQGGDLAASLAAGLDATGSGMLINVSRSLAQAADMRAYAADLHAAINRGRANVQPRPRGEEAAVRLALALHETGCVKFGQFTLASGQSSPIYIDLRMLVSDTATLHLASEGYVGLLSPLAYDRIASIPYAALPIGTAVSLSTGKPMIYPRKEAKSYGTGLTIEGHHNPGETVVVLDDLITNGDSKIKAIAPLLEAGLQVRDIVVLIDREQGGADQLADSGYRLHAVLGMRRLLEILVRHGRISAEQQAEVLAFLAGGRA